MYWTFEFLDLKILESIVLVLPYDLFCLGEPSFSKHTVSNASKLHAYTVSDVSKLHAFKYASYARH